MLPWLLCGALAAIVLILCIRLRLLQKSLDEIAAQLEERLGSDTNNPIFLSARDPHARKLAGTLNVQLKELRRLRQRYENGDRELKEAVTNVSHDLRTPLTAICGYLELLDRGDKTPDQARYLALIADRAEAMRQLTEELLRYSVAAGPEEELTLESVDLNAAVEEAVASFYGALVEGGVTPHVSLWSERVVRRLDRAALSRVLGNLLNNALRHGGGDLEVTLDSAGGRPPPGVGLPPPPPPPAGLGATTAAGLAGGGVGVCFFFSPPHGGRAGPLGPALPALFCTLCPGSVQLAKPDRAESSIARSGKRIRRLGALPSLLVLLEISGAPRLGKVKFLFSKIG